MNKWQPVPYTVPGKSACKWIVVNKITDSPARDARNRTRHFAYLRSAERAARALNEKGEDA